MNTFFEEQNEPAPAHNNLYTDYRAEVVAMNLIKYYKDVDEIMLARLGSNDRTFHKDIKDMEEKIQDLGEKVVYINTYRESISDYLPEGVFYPPSLGNYRNGVANIIYQIQKQRETAESARKFFRPFEMESYYVMLTALFVETNYDLESNTKDLMNIMYELLPLLKEFDLPTAKTFTCLLPFFHAARGSKSWLEKCLAAFLQLPVKISFTPNRIIDKDIEETSASPALSKMRLGITSVLCGSHLDGNRNWAIRIGAIPYGRLNDYIPSSNLRKLLQKVYDYCVPATVRVEEHFITKKEKDSFVLSKDGNTGILGFSTFL